MVMSEKASLSIGGWAAAFLLIFLWAAGSSMDLEKYAAKHIVLCLISGIGAVILLLSCIRFFSKRSFSQPFGYIIIGLWLLVVLSFSIIHPISARHVVTQGNDSEDALYRGATNLVNLHFPYYARTYLHNPITPMPGALILDSPFAMMGKAGLQNVFWFGIFAGFTAIYFRQRSTALICLLLVLANAHTFVNLMTGADYPVNCLYICIAIFWFLRESDRLPTWQYWTSSLFLGLALSSRPTYLLVIPLLLTAYLIQLVGLRRTLQRISQPLTITILVTVPYYLYDRARFSPLHVANFLSAMTPAHQRAVFVMLVGTAILIAITTFFIKMTIARVYFFAALALGTILLPPGVIVAIHQNFSVEGLVVLGYTDTAYIFLCLWLCRYLEATKDRPKAELVRINRPEA